MRIPALFLLIVSFTLAACDSRDEIVAYTAPKEQPATAPSQAQSPASAHDHTHDGAGVHWTLPQGWVKQADQQMRVASFKTSSESSAADVILTKFPATVLNDPLANINRYRGMVGLPPLDDASKQPVEEIKVDGSLAKRFQFDGADKKLTIIAIPRGEIAWFVRFIGPIATVDKEKSNFDSFVQSLHW